MTISTRKSPTLLVNDVLSGSEKPMTAYEILAALAEKGVSGPPTVYRALEKLMQEGKAHRIKSLNAYTACQGEHDTQTTTAFAVCTRCGSVDEIHDTRLDALIHEVSHSHHFQLQQEMIELMGLCGTCTSNA